MFMDLLNEIASWFLYMKLILKNTKYEKIKKLFNLSKWDLNMIMKQSTCHKQTIIDP